MSLKHADIWRAIDRLAEQNGLSASGLAKKSGLSPTVFNPSKRFYGKRKRWPSTESISYILQATGASLEEFVAMASPEEGRASQKPLPLLSTAQAGREGHFDEAGYPTGKGWEDIHSPSISDAHAFALEISGKSLEPVYREGDRIVLSPAEKPRRGDRVVVRTLKGEVMIKALGRENAQKIELLALNPELPLISLPTRDIDWIYRIVWASQ